MSSGCDKSLSYYNEEFGLPKTDIILHFLDNKITVNGVHFLTLVIFYSYLKSFGSSRIGLAFIFNQFSNV